MYRLYLFLCLLLFAPAVAQSSFVYQRIEKGQVCYRVYNLPEGGFEIVAGEARDGRLLAKVDRGMFDIHAIPENMSWWLDQYAEVISTMKLAEVPARGLKANEQSIAPLIKSQWGQEYPFNCAIPYSTNRYLTGCVATAMGQVMRYHQLPQTGSGRTSQIVDGLSFKANFSETNYNFKLMKDRYDAGQYTEAEAQAMSTLLFHAGMGVSMSYGTTGSGAMVSSVPRCLSSNFGYDKSLTYEIRKYYSDKEWHTLLYNELVSGRPIIYRGSNVSDESRQHCFVCDGYDAATGLFHFNWGWSGVYDGYFALDGSSSLDGPTFNYGNSQSAVIGIRPAPEKTEYVTRLSCSTLQMKVKPAGSSLSSAYSQYVIADGVTELPAISLTASVRNSGLLAKALRAGVRLTDMVTQEVRYLPADLTGSLSYSVLKTVTAKISSSELPTTPGRYTLAIVFRPSASTSDDDWTAPQMAPDIELPILQVGGSDESQRQQDKNDESKIESKVTVVASQSYQVEREVGQGNIWTRVEYDETAICQALGVSSIISDMLFPVKLTTGEILSNGQDYDGWFNPQGNPMINSGLSGALLNVPAPSAGVVRLHTDPTSELSVGDTCRVRWAFVNGDKMVALDVKVTIVESQKPEEEVAWDYTHYIVNPDFTDNVLTGWEGDEWSQYEGDENAEHYAGIPNTYQKITGLPKGIYLLEVDGLDRMGFWEQAVEWYNKREIHGNRAVIYANSSVGVYQCAMRQLMDGAGENPLNAGREIQVFDSDGKICYVPDNMVAAGAYFREGRYRNGLYVEVGDDGILTIGVTNGISYPYYLDGNWICVDNWHLTYMGEDYKEHYPGETIYSTRGPEIVNPNYDGNDVYSGWLGFLFPYWASPVAAYEKRYDYCLDNYQYLSGLTPGKYLLEVDGLFTFWCWEEDGRMYWHDIRKESNLCHLYARSSLGDFQVPITRTCYGVKDEPSYTDEYRESEWYSGWLPNNVISHIPHVSEDCYHNGMYVEVGVDGELKIGLRESVIEGIPFPNRMAFDNWKLTYLGKSHPAPSGADLYGFRKQFDTHKEYLAFQQQLDDFLVSSVGNGMFDMTSLLRFPGFDSQDDYVHYWWKNNPTLDWGCAEKWNCNFDVYQETSPLPEGYYELHCQGFYRYNDSEDNSNAVAVRAHTDGTERLNACLYANGYSVPLQSIVADMSVLRNDPSTSAVFSNEFESGLPFSMSHSRLAFDAGLYDDNVIRFYLNGYEPLRFGIRKTECLGADWTIFDNFRLYYYGKNKPEDFVLGIESASHVKPLTSVHVYDLYGRQRQQLRSGLNIVNGRLIYK